MIALRHRENPTTCGQPIRSHNGGFALPGKEISRMAFVPLVTVLDHAAENGYGVAAFNVNNMEQIQSIMEAA